MVNYSIKVSIDDIAVREPFSMANGDDFIIRFKDRDTVMKVIEQLENLLLTTKEE